MPSGKVHHKIWGRFLKSSIVLALVTASIGYLFDKSFMVWYTLVLLGYIMGRYISPDLDLIGINNDESRMMDELKIIGVLLVMWFFPYAYVMRFVGIGKRGHRNFFSHFPLISTLIRLLWLFCAPLVLIWQNYPQYIPISLEAILLLTVGLGYADTLHYVADMHRNKKFVRNILGIKRIP